MFQRIFVPLDGSPRAELALPLAMRLTRVWRGTLVLGRVIEQPTSAEKLSLNVETSSLRKSEDQEEAEALEYLAGKAAKSARTGIQVHPVIASGAPAPSLLEVVRREQIDLVVMCSQGLTGIKRWALGSVAQQVIRQCSVPVLLLRERNMKLNEKVGQPTRVAVALDGSSFAEAALLPAADLVAALHNTQSGCLCDINGSQPRSPTGRNKPSGFPLL